MTRSGNNEHMAARRGLLEYETASDSGSVEEGVASGENETYQSKQRVD